MTKHKREDYPNLTEEQFDILYEEATEAPYSYEDSYPKSGLWHCANCKNPLFEPQTKFNSGTGWPSFYQALDGSTKEKKEFMGGGGVKEVKCAGCDGHLGHVFRERREGNPTDLRYCMNGAVLEWKDGGKE